MRCLSCRRVVDPKGIRMSFELSEGEKFWCSRCIESGQAARSAQFNARIMMVFLHFMLWAMTMGVFAGTMPAVIYAAALCGVVIVTLGLFAAIADERLLLGPKTRFAKMQRVWVCVECELHWFKKWGLITPESCGLCGGPVRESFMVRRDGPRREQ
jgi:hypothetical protein